MNIDEQIRELEIKQAKIDGKLEAQDGFQDKVIEELAYLRKRNADVYRYMEAHMRESQAKADMAMNIKSKIIISGVWGTIVIMAGVGWYALKAFLLSGGAN